MAIVVFMIYLLGVKMGLNPSLILFWSPIIIMVVVVLQQIINFGQKDKSVKVILSEIFFMTLALHLVFIVPISTGLIGRDVHYDYYATKTIMDSGWPIPENISILTRTRRYSEWPMLHMFAGMVSTIMGADLFIVAKWLPSVYSSFAIIFVYLLAKTIYDNERSALLAAFGVSAILWYIYFHSKFLREGFAFVLFFAVLYTCVKAFKKRNIIFQFLGILLALALIFSHHLTSFMLLLFLCVWVVFYRFSLWRLLKIWPFNVFRTRPAIKLSTIKLSLTFLAFIFISTISHWIFVGEWVINVLTLLVNEIGVYNYLDFEYIVYKLNPQNLFIYRRTLGSDSPRVTIASYGNLLLAVTFGILILSEIVRSKDHKNVPQNFYFLTWAGLIFITATVIPRIDFARFITFGYPFLLIVAAHVILKKRNRRTLCILFAIFVLLQVFSIPPYIYDHSVLPEYQARGYRDFYLPQEYKAAYWFNFSGVAIGDYSANELFGGLRQLNVIYNETAVRVFEGSLETLKKYDWMIFRDEDMQGTLINQMSIARHRPLTDERYRLHLYLINATYRRFNETPYLIKAYDNGEVQIYHICQT
jgi:hypothetical protein